MSVRTAVLVAALVTTLAGAGPAQAVEYKLQVVNLWDTALAAYATTAELRDGASGPGLERLTAGLDAGTVPAGVVLGDRTLRWAGATVAHAYGTVRVLADIVPGGQEKTRWDEVRWEGKPGERSVWVVAPSGNGRPQRLHRVLLKGEGPVRQFMPYTPVGSGRSAAVRFPLSFLWFNEERSGLWERYLAPSLDLGEGLGAVVGQNSNVFFPDHVYLIVKQADRPTTYKAVLLWRAAVQDFEAPDGPTTPPFTR